jgi:hypothetical protein
MRLCALALALTACGTRIEIELPRDAGAYAQSPAAVGCSDVACDWQIDCLLAGLVSPSPCEEWVCPLFGACAGHCMVVSVPEGGGCKSRPDGCEGMCRDGMCEPMGACR